MPFQAVGEKLFGEGFAGIIALSAARPHGCNRLFGGVLREAPAGRVARDRRWWPGVSSECDAEAVPERSLFGRGMGRVTDVT